MKVNLRRNNPKFLLKQINNENTKLRFNLKHSTRKDFSYLYCNNNYRLFDIQKTTFKNNSKNTFSGLYNTQIRNFSIAHNYHSPKVLYSGIREFTHEENISSYNKYIQAFLNKRFTHKKEITPKIGILNIPKGYHNTLYTQKSYPFFNLYDIQNMRFIKSVSVLNTGYIISRFFEEYEKPMYDALLSKIIVSGRVEFSEDSEKYDKIKSKINSLINIFYNGDSLSALEREIERSYLILKIQKQNELMKLYAANQKLKREEIFVSYSELNKLSGHVNFRMHHPEYNFKSKPIFEKINVERMFYSLFEIRYNSLGKHQYWEKLKLKYQYRKSLIENPEHRVQYLSNYIFTQVIQYIDSYEFNNYFDLNLNFKVNLNMAILHIWFIINKLNDISISEKETENTKKFSKALIEDLIERLIEYSENNQFKFEFYNSNKDLDKISDTKFFIRKLLDTFTYHFCIFENTKKNNFLHLPLLLNGMVFNNIYDIQDKNIKKLSLYVYEHFYYFLNKSYSDIETCDFEFSVFKIPINYNDYIINNDNKDFYNYFSYSNLMKDYIENKEEMKKKIGFDENLILENFKYQKNKLLSYKKIKNKDTRNIEWIIKEYGTIPFEDKRLFMKFDYSKTLMYRIHMFIKNENDIDRGLLLEKVLIN